MKVYLAGEREAIEKSTGEPALWSRFVQRRLFSYYYHGCTTGNKPSSDLLASARRSLDLFLDSGAFTAFTQKVDIPLERYARFIQDTGFWTVCSNLDDTSKNEKKSYENQKALESLGAKVQPVFHTREDTRWLVKYLDEGYDYIFLGGMVPETTGWLMNWLDDLWDKFLINPDGTARVKVHGFGLTDQSLMFRYPWYSVDSTSWLMTGVFGACLFLTPSGARKVVFSSSSPQAKKIDGWHYETLPSVLKRQVDRWLEPFGVTAAQCAEHYSYRDAVNAAVFQSMETLGTHRFHKTQGGLFDA
jgi:hypothetical protein